MRRKTGFDKVNVNEAVESLIKENPYNVVTRARLSTCIKGLLAPSDKDTMEFNQHLVSATGVIRVAGGDDSEDDAGLRRGKAWPGGTA